jgi:hypothetical protein
MPSHPDRVRANYDDNWWKPASGSGPSHEGRKPDVTLKGIPIVVDPTVRPGTMRLERRGYAHFNTFSDIAIAQLQRELGPPPMPKEPGTTRRWFRAMRAADVEQARRQLKARHFTGAYGFEPIIRWRSMRVDGWTLFDTQNVIDRTTAPHYRRRRYASSAIAQSSAGRAKAEYGEKFRAQMMGSWDTSADGTLLRHVKGDRYECVLRTNSGAEVRKSRDGKVTIISTPRGGKRDWLTRRFLEDSTWACAYCTEFERRLHDDPVTHAIGTACPRTGRSFPERNRA